MTRPKPTSALVDWVYAAATASSSTATDSTGCRQTPTHTHRERDNTNMWGDSEKTCNKQQLLPDLEIIDITTSYSIKTPLWG